MSILEKLRSSLSFYRKPQDRLVTQAKLWATSMLPHADVITRTNEVSRHVGRVDGKDRWKSWRWLIATHQTAHEQELLLRNCHRVVQRAAAIDLDDDGRKSLDESLIRCFRDPLGLEPEETPDLDVLADRLTERRSLWQKLAQDVRKARPPVFVSHAFLRLSDSTGVEVASLLIAGLIGLGAVYMAFFYSTATGQTANAYWTLDDLFIQGILVLPQIGATLIIVELVFLVVRRTSRGVGNYRWHGAIMAHPLRVAFGFIVLMSVVLSVDGHRRGKQKLEEFVTKVELEEYRQMATVMDRSILNNVFLVGTTDRTAIFLQMVDTAKSVKAIPPSLGEAASCIASSFGIGKGTCNGGSSENYRVLVMDRALVVCHAKMGECPTGAEDEKLDVIANQVTDLDTRVAAIELWSGIHDERVKISFEHIETHMNRHLKIVLAKLVNKKVDLPRNSRPEDANSTGANAGS